MYSPPALEYLNLETSLYQMEVYDKTVMGEQFYIGYMHNFRNTEVQSGHYRPTDCVGISISA